MVHKVQPTIERIINRRPSIWDSQSRTPRTITPEVNEYIIREL